MPRPRVIILVLSIAANAVFCVTLWLHAVGITGTSPAHSSKSTTLDTAAPSEIPAAAIWSYLTDNSTDDTVLISRLRAEGFPQNIIRLIVQLRVREHFGDQYRALVQKEVQTPYWIRVHYSSTSEIRTARRALDSQVNNVVRGLLGAGADKQPGEPGYEDPARLYGNIPSEKIAKIETLNRDYEELISSAREAELGITLPEDREKIRFLEKEKRADLVALLTPGELEEYDSRNSPTAQQVRERLRYFDSTEAEYLALYRIHADFDQRYERPSELSPQERAQYVAARDQLESQIQTALGLERYAEYDLTTNGSYRMTDAFVVNSNLAPTATRSLVTLEHETDRQLKILRADHSLNYTQHNAALVELQKTSTEKVTSIVGADRIESYKSGPGYWLHFIVPVTSAPGSAR